MMMAAAKAADVRVLMVDDEQRVLDSLSGVLVAANGVRLVGTLPSADDLVPTVIQLRPQVVLLDLDMPGRSAAEAIEDLRYRGDPARVLVLSAHMQDWRVRGALAFGAAGYIHKDDAPDAIFEGLSAVMDGVRYLSPRIAEAFPDLV